MKTLLHCLVVLVLSTGFANAQVVSKLDCEQLARWLYGVSQYRDGGVPESQMHLAVVNSNQDEDLDLVQRLHAEVVTLYAEKLPGLTAAAKAGALCVAERDGI